VTLLCAGEHSPANNESRARWLTWGWAATKLVGGIVIAGINISGLSSSGGLSGPFATMSMLLGRTAFKSGFRDLDTLIAGDG